MPKAKRLELIATDGAHTVRLVWVKISNSGVYESVFHPSVAMHHSYHRDGTVHMKADPSMERVRDADKVFNESGYSLTTASGPPLDSFTGHFTFLQGMFRLDPDCFKGRVTYDSSKVDRLVILDSRTIDGDQRFVEFYLDPIEVGSYQILIERMAKYQHLFTVAGRICEHRCYLEFQPWVLVTLAYSSR